MLLISCGKCPSRVRWLDGNGAETEMIQVKGCHYWYMCCKKKKKICAHWLTDFFFLPDRKQIKQMLCFLQVFWFPPTEQKHATLAWLVTLNCPYMWVRVWIAIVRLVCLHMALWWTRGLFRVCPISCRVCAGDKQLRTTQRDTGKESERLDG